LLKRLLVCIDRACHESYADEVISCVTTTVTESLGARSAVVALLDQQTDFLAIHGAEGLSPQFVRNYRRTVGTGVLGQVILNGREVFIGEVEPDSEEATELRMELDFKSVMCVRIATSGRGMGFLLAESPEPNRFRPDDLVVLRLLACVVALSVERDRMLAADRQVPTSETPAVVYSYSYFHRRLTEEIERAQRLNERLSLVLISADNLSEHRQLHGTQKADEVFAELVDRLKRAIRSIDVIGRYGAGQLVIYMPETSQEAALKAAERIHKLIERHGYTIDDLPMTASIGVATLPENGETVNQLMNALSSALFKARRAGSHRVSGPAETYVL